MERLAQLLLALLALALVVQLVQRGPGGAAAWMKAKFLGAAAQMAVGIVLALLGAFVLLRTVRRPEGGRNLVDLILGKSA